MIKGKYNLGEVAYVDWNYGYNDFSNIVHEFMHRKLATSTIFGFINFLLEQTRINTNYKNLKDISNIMQDASLVINENFALIHQLLSIYLCQNDEFNCFVSRFKKSDYYYTYYGKLILDILNKIDIKDLMSTNIINRIACMAMNIDVTKLNEDKILDSKYIETKISNNSEEFNPSDRYIMLLKSLYKLSDIYDVINITDEILLEDTSLECIEGNKNNFLLVMKKLIKQFQLQKIDTTIIDENIKNIEKTTDENFISNEVSEEQIYSIFDETRPMVLNDNYEILLPEKVTDEHLKCHVMRVMLNDGQSDGLEYHAVVTFYNVAIGREYRFLVGKNYLGILISQFSELILIFQEDYRRIISEYPIIRNRSIFLEINTSYNRCKEYIINDMSLGKETMLQQGNDKIFFTFVKQKDNNIFVMYFYNEVLNLMKKDIEDRFFNIIPVDDDGLDGQFYINNTDWCNYEDIIRVITGTYIIDIDDKFPPLGTRIYFE